MLGGKIDVTSTKNRGSVFYFSIEFTVAYHNQKEIILDRASIKGKKCLIVSDKISSGRILSIYINYWGCKCEEAATIKDAEDKYRTAERAKKPFDVIIVDFNEKNKLQPYRDIVKILPESANCALISITEIGMKGDADELKKIGYNAYLSNPLKQSQLCNAIMIATGSKNEEEILAKERKFLTKYSIDEIVPERYRVLIVEDTPTNVTIFVKLLSKIGINCDVVENGKIAIDAVKTHSYDIVFMDCQMPVMDGYEATEIIRKEITGGKDIIIIAVTANVIEESRKKCIDVGMNDVITKPFKFSEIVKTLKRYLKKSK
jgi:CheY-like chemotaxis protein